MGGGGRGADDDGEERYAYALSDAGAGRAGLVRARVFAETLEGVLRRLLPGGRLIVRAAPCGGSTVVLAELCAEDSAALREHLALIDPATWKIPGSCGFDFARWLNELSALEPIGFVARPGVRYGASYRQARIEAAALAGVLRRASGWWVVDPDCWQDGTGVVRLTLNLEDTERLTEVLS